MYNHYFNENGEYKCSIMAYDWAVPAPDCIRLEDRIDIPAGFWPVVNATKDGFALVENHRGKEGWVGKKRIKITALGPLPDGWTENEPASLDTRTPAEKREDAYLLEVDQYRNDALSYQLEANAYRLDGNLTAAVAAEEKMNAALRCYRDKKEEIRARFPDTKYLLSPTGTYHDTACSYTGQSSDLLTLAEIAGRNPGAKPCSRCNPPTL